MVRRHSRALRAVAAYGDLAMSKHTPEPWDVLGEDEISPGCPCIEISAGELATSEWKQICYVQPTLNDDDDFFLSDEDRANARLIAAAPEMAEALHALRARIDSEFEHQPGDVLWVEEKAAEAALRKAGVIE